MRIYCDQNIMEETVEFLSQLGHDVTSTRHTGLSIASDKEFLEFAISKNRIL